jgi:hypothetical protein
MRETANVKGVDGHGQVERYLSQRLVLIAKVIGGVKLKIH